MHLCSVHVHVFLSFIASLSYTHPLKFSNNTKNGEGTLFYSNGDVFVGHWMEERKEGDGELVQKMFLKQNLSKPRPNLYFKKIYA